MPELPEAETIKSQISRILPVKIRQINLSKVARKIIIGNFKQLEATRIHSIDRIGKMIKFNLDAELFIISKLGMTGNWRISNTSLSERHKHLEFICENNLFISYIDPRRFGRLILFKSHGLVEFIKQFGPDLTSPEFSSTYIYETLKKYPMRNLKPFLLDQKFFPGIGNYMASEICALAKILPTRLAKNISSKDAERIKAAADSLIKRSIASQGVTFSGGYADAFGLKGDGLAELVVFYQKICGMCKKQEVTKIFMAGRGTYYCPQCQK